jgi:hypothetical protein
MSPENLSRNFAQFADLGVAVRGREVSLRDTATLRSFANPTPSIDDADY